MGNKNQKKITTTAINENVCIRQESNFLSWGKIAEAWPIVVIV